MTVDPAVIPTVNDESPRIVGIVVGAVVLALTLCLALAAMSSPEGVTAAEAEIQVDAFDTAEIGGVDPTSSDLNQSVEGRTFAAVRDGLGDRQPSDRTLTVPLRSVLGSLAVTMEDVDLVVDEEQHQVVLRGALAEPIEGVADAGDEAILIADWVAEFHEEPSFAVSVVTPGATVADALGMEPGESFAADLGTTGAMYTVGHSGVDANNDPEQTHLKYSDNLTAHAVDFYEQIYGDEALPSTVPAIDDIDARTHLSLPVDLDTLNDMPRDMFGIGDGAVAVFEGGIGIGLAEVPTFDPTTGGWSLGVVLPRTDLDQSALFPDFLELDSTARFTASIAYGQEASVEDNQIDPDEAPAPATPPPTRPTVTFELTADMTSDFFGHTQAYTAQFQIARPTDRPGDLFVTMDIEASEDWEEPFGLEFLDITGAELEVVVKRQTPVGGGQPTTSHDVLVKGSAEIAGKEFEIRLSGAFDPSDTDVTAVLSLNDSISMAETLEHFGAPVSDLPEVLTGTSIGPAGIQLRISRGAADDEDEGSTSTTEDTSSTTQDTSTTAPPNTTQTSVAITVMGEVGFTLPHGQSVSAAAMVSFDSKKDRNGNRGVTVALRAQTEINLVDFLPATGVDAPFDLELVNENSALGFVVTTRPIAQRMNDQPTFIRDFYKPLYGRQPGDQRDLEVILPAGFSMLGYLELPESIADAVGTIGLQSYVSVRGTLPVFESNKAVALSLGLGLDGEILPDFVDQVVGSLEVTVGQKTGTPGGPGGPGGGTELTLKMGLKGDLRLRLPAGLPPEVAEPLNTAGIPVEVFEDVPENYACANGSAPQPYSDDAFRCYDLISLSVDAGIKFSTGGGLELDFGGAFTTPRPGDIYRPFGLEWLGIDDARFRLKIGVTDGNVSLTPGMQGDIQIGETDLFAAIQLQINLLSTAPYANVKLEGIRVASGAGIDLQDFFDIQHAIATVAARAAGQSDPPAFNMDDLPIPNLALRNLEFSFSPEGVPALCIPQGLVLSGDFYINPSGDEPINNPACDNGTSVIPDEADQCLNRRSDGCLASGRLRISNNGFQGLAQIGGFDLGPVHLEDAELSVAITLADQHLRISGGGSVDNPVTGDTLVSGQLAVEFSKTGIIVYSRAQIIDLQALIQIETGLGSLTEPEPSLLLRAVLASDQASVASPSLVDGINEALSVPLDLLLRAIVIGDDILSDFERDGIIAAVARLPENLRNIGVPVPPEFIEFIDQMDDFISAAEDISEFVWEIVEFGWDVFMNGVDSFGFGPEEVCIFGGCVTIIPRIEFPGFAGMCDDIFPEPTFSALRDPGSGDCEPERLIRGVVFPLIENAINEIVGSDINLTELIDELGGLLDSDAPLIQLDCAEYELQLDSNSTDTSMALTGAVFGRPFGFEIGVDFADPLGSIGSLFTDLVAQLLNPGSVQCIGPDPEVFDVAGPVLDPGELVAVARPGGSVEGEEVTLSGLVQLADYPGATSTNHVVTVDWGDGSTSTLDPITTDVDSPEVAFTATHRYADDSLAPEGDGLFPIKVTDSATSSGPQGNLGNGSDEAATAVGVRNAAPEIIGDLVGEAKEHDTYVLELQVTDPGQDDLTVVVTWGDGSTDEVVLAASGIGPQSHQVHLEHVFDGIADGARAGAFDVGVTVQDGEGGRDDLGRRVIVENIPPNVLEVETPLVTSEPTGVFDVALDEPTSFILCGVGETEPALEDMRLCGLADRVEFLGEAAYDFERPEDWDEELFEQTFWFRGMDRDGAIGPAVSATSILDTTGPLPPEVRASGEQVVIGGTDDEPIIYTSLTDLPVGYDADTPIHDVVDTQIPEEASEPFRVTDFECHLDGVDVECGGEFTGPVTTVDGVFWRSSGAVTLSGLESGTHDFEIRAADAGGNWSPWTTQTIIVDTSAPNVSFVETPPPTGGYSGDFSYTTDDPSEYVPGYPGPVTYECWSARQEVVDQPGFEPQWADCFGGHGVVVEPNSAYVFGVRATDALGNLGEPLEYRWETGLAPLSVEFDLKPRESTAATSARFTWHTEGGEPDQQLSTQTFLDGQPAGADQPVDVAGLAPGLHTFEVRVTDHSTDPPRVAVATHRWFVDDHPDGPFDMPITVISEAPLGIQLTESNDVLFEFFAAEAEGAPETETFRCVLMASTDDVTVDDLTDDCTSPLTYEDLADGHYTFAVSAFDADGRIDLTPAVWNFHLNTAPAPQPDLYFTQTPPDESAGPFEFAWELENYPDDVIVRCSIRQPQFASPDGYSDLFPDGYLETAREDCTSPHDSGLESRGDGFRSFNVWVYAADGETVVDHIEHGLTVDLDYPDTTIDSGLGDAVNTDTRIFHFSSTRTPATFRCALVDGTVEVAVDDITDECTSPTTYADLADGDYTFAVTSIGADGRVDSTPAIGHFTVDSAAPSARFTETPPFGTEVEEYTFAWEHENYPAGTVMTCALDSSNDAGPPPEPVPCESPTDVDIRDRVWDVSGSGYSVLTFTVFFETVDGEPINQIDYVFRFGETQQDPETIITSGPEGTPDEPSNDVSPTFEFSSDNPDATFECRLFGDVEWEPCTSPHTIDAEGFTVDLTFQVRAVDEFGTDFTPAEHNWYVDTQAPFVTIQLTPPNPSYNTTAAFSVLSETGATFECSLDGAPWAPCSGSVVPSSEGDVLLTSYSDLQPGNHAFRVRASDPAGFVSEVGRYTWNIDLVTPETELTGFPLGVAGDTVEFAYESDDPEATFQCRINTQPWKACQSPSTHAVPGPGEHTFAVRARNADGMLDPTPATFTFTAEGAVPDVTITEAPTELVSSTSATVAFTVDVAGATTSCRLDDGAWAPCTSPVTYDDLAEGDHTVRIRATAEGVTGPAAATTWTIDATVPTVEIVSGPASPTEATTADFVVETDDPDAVLRCQLDRGAIGPCEPDTSYGELSEGRHEFRAWAFDPAGNRSTPDSHTWTIDIEDPPVDTTPPVVTITDAPSGTVDVTSASVVFEANEDPVTFECRLDGAAWAACTSPFEVTDLADGEHTVDVRATDGADNVGDPVSASWTVDTEVDPPVDTTPPVVTITDAPSGTVDVTSASVVFEANEDPVTFECRLDGAAWAACTSPFEVTDLADGEHTVDVRATDGADNVGDPASVSWTVDTEVDPPVDTTPPVVTITDAPSGTVTETSASVVFEANEAASFECRLDGGEWAACTTPFEVTDLADGAHTVDVRATDGAGNTSLTALATWIIEPSTAELVVSIDSAPPSLTSEPTAEFTFTSEGATRFECRLDDGAWAECTSPATYADLADGSHTFAVRAFDADDNQSNTAQRTWTVDTAVLGTTITDAPSEVTGDPSASVTFTADDPSASFECRLDDAAWAPCTSPQAVGPLEDGVHRFEVRATDPAGNVGEAAVAEWVLDTSAPVIDIDEAQAPEAETTETSATFAFTITDDSGVNFFFAQALPATVQSVVCSLDGADPTACTSPTIYTGLAVGDHTFSITAVDTAGNSTTANYAWTIVGQAATSTTQPDVSATTSQPDVSSSTTEPTSSTSSSSGPVSSSTSGPSTSGDNAEVAAGAPTGDDLARTGTDISRAVPLALQMILYGMGLCAVAAMARYRLQRR